MKKFTLALFLVITAFSLQANIVYVQANANGNGSSWTNALGNLAIALQQAQSGDQVWVAKGTYVPGTSRDASFQIKDGVEVYGGFAGHETALHQRDFKNNKTILSGEINTPSLDDNSYTIVYMSNVSESTIFDGFVIKAAFANGKSTKGNRQRCGGAIFNDGSNGKSNPTIANCSIQKNYAREGAGIYNKGTNGIANPTITNCQFFENKADLDGGAIFNNGKSGVASPSISECQFVGNEATYGGGILNQGSYNGQSSPEVVSCTFNNNISYLRGGSMYNVEEGGVCEPMVKFCKFSDNKVTVGKEQYKSQATRTGGKSVLKVRK